MCWVGILFFIAEKLVTKFEGFLVDSIITENEIILKIVQLK